MKYDVIGFAKEELAKYLKKLNVEADISLCLFEDLKIIDKKVIDSTYDDAIEISVKNCCGYIAGSNDRSVLIGVYRLLHEWGIRWIRPGKNGTFIPDKASACDVMIHEAADRRHRTMCIEGAVSIENVLDMIEWLPKVGMNGYYIQFDDAFIFFDRWYGHRKNPFKEPEVFTEEMAAEYVKIMTREIKKRGLLLQRMGHGWTCEPFGVKNNGWDPVDPDTIPQEYKDLCAMVGGKRYVYNDSPVATQLCYSNPYVIEKMTNAVIEYVEKNPESDVIHFWLGDFPNNTCECPECTKYHYSDYYVNMVNIITREFNKRGIKNKVVFTVSGNKTNPPIHEKIEFSDNIIMMFAPISRTFGVSFPNEFKIKTVPKYKINAYSMPRSVDENLSSLYVWEQFCPNGDVVDFDYHLMWDHILDAGGECIAKVLHQDIKNFTGLGINGLISCQLQRNAFPTSIAMTTMAKTLWNVNTDFNEVKKELYTACFGAEDCDTLCDYFATLSRGFDIGAIRSQVEVDREQFKADMRAAVKAMEDIEKLISSRVATVTNPCHKASWELIELHRQIYLTLGRGIVIRLDGDIAGGNKLRDESVEFAWKYEDKIQEVLDTMFYFAMTNERINLEGAIGFMDFKD